MWHNIRSREVAPTWAWTMGASSAIRPSDSNSEATLLISLRRDSLALRSWKERKNSVIHCLFKFKYIHKKEGFHRTAAVLCYTTFNYLCFSHCCGGIFCPLFFMVLLQFAGICFCTTLWTSNHSISVGWALNFDWALQHLYAFFFVFCRFASVLWITVLLHGPNLVVIWSLICCVYNSHTSKDHIQVIQITLSQ